MVEQVNQFIQVIFNMIFLGFYRDQLPLFLEGKYLNMEFPKYEEENEEVNDESL